MFPVLPGVLLRNRDRLEMCVDNRRARRDDACGVMLMNLHGVFLLVNGRHRRPLLARVAPSRGSQGIVQLTRGPVVIVEHDGRRAKFRASVGPATGVAAAVPTGDGAGEDVGIIEGAPLAAAGAALIFAAPMLTVISVG